MLSHIVNVLQGGFVRQPAIQEYGYKLTLGGDQDTGVHASKRLLMNKHVLLAVWHLSKELLHYVGHTGIANARY